MEVGLRRRAGVDGKAELAGDLWCSGFGGSREEVAAGCAEEEAVLVEIRVSIKSLVEYYVFIVIQRYRDTVLTSRERNIKAEE